MESRRRSISVMNVGLSEGAGDDLFRRLSRTFSGKSRRQQEEGEELEEHGIERWTSRNEKNEIDNASDKTKVNDWRLDQHVKDIQANDPAEGRSLGVTWKDLTVKVVPSDATLQENVLSQFNKVQQAKEARNKAPLKTILDGSFGCVKPGEMLLVLGRPGSGCTTLLKMLANKRKGYVHDGDYLTLDEFSNTPTRYAEVDGDVRFGSMTAKEAEQYRGSIVINTEEELFYPSLTVGKVCDHFRVCSPGGDH
jgi:ATPase subunit of ABC transporter with duplicated ATPase domains